VFCREEDALRGVLYVEELSRGAAGSPHRDVIFPPRLRVHALLDQGRDDVGGGGIEVVARPIEVHREEEDRVESVLLPIGL